MTLLSALDELEKNARSVTNENWSEWIATHSPNDVLKLIATVRVMREALAEFQLGHEHADGLDHIRIMGNTYGWCDYCSTKVTFGPGYAEATLAKAEEIWK